VRRFWFRPALVALIVVVPLWLAPTPAVAAEESTARTGAVGAGAALCTLVYAPLKVAHAVGGLVLSGLTFLWTAGDSEPAKAVFYTAIGGDYVVTPAHLNGERDLHFLGSP
jgi:hypothetical protein